MSCSVDAGEFAVETTTTTATPASEAQQQRKEGTCHESTATTTSHPSLSQSPITQSSNIKSKKRIAPTTAPNRALCRAVVEKYLGWDLQDQDFVLPDDGVQAGQAQEGLGNGGGDRLREAGGDEDNSIEERENAVALRAAFGRRERKLSEVLSGVQINDEAGGLVPRHEESD